MEQVGERAEVRFIRRYPVGCEKVWRAWTDPRALSAWFGPGDPGSVSLTIVLSPVPEGTELDFRHDRFFDAAARANHERGWTQAFAHLDAWISSGPDRADSGRPG